MLIIILRTLKIYIEYQKNMKKKFIFYFEKNGHGFFWKFSIYEYRI